LQFLLNWFFARRFGIRHKMTYSVAEATFAGIMTSGGQIVTSLLVPANGCVFNPSVTRPATFS